jgi:HPt (histidine-containing phosphotransfer) domain-containing protein
MGQDKIVVFVDKDLQDIMPGFLKNRQKDLVELQTHLKNNDSKSIQVIGHKLSGNAGGYGLDKLGEYGAALETAAIKNDVTTMTKNIQLITDYITRLEVRFK